MWISPAFHLKVIRAYDELVTAPEPIQALPNFDNPVEAARAWADECEAKQNALVVAEEQTRQIEEAKPSVEFVENYTTSIGNKGFRKVAKLLGANEKEFRAFLVSARIMYKLDGEWMPYQNHLTLNRFVVTTGTNHEGFVYNAAKFTPKGVYWVSGLWNDYLQNYQGSKSKLKSAIKRRTTAPPRAQLALVH